MKPNARLAAICGIALAAALGGCGKEPVKNGAALDNELDPALAGALEDQIMVDPSLAGQSNRNNARPGAGPSSAPIPPRSDAGGAPPPVDRARLLRTPAPKPGEAAGKMTLGQLAERQAGGRGPAKACEKKFQYSMGWAAKMPAAIPLYPGAQVSEAAGNDSPTCRIRIVSFTSGAELPAVLDWYYTVAVRAGYTAEHQASGAEHVLAGTRDADGGAYYVTLRPRGRGTEVDLIANNGR